MNLRENGTKVIGYTEVEAKDRSWKQAALCICIFAGLRWQILKIWNLVGVASEDDFARVPLQRSTLKERNVNQRMFFFVCASFGS